jgi:hypothetical protein
VICSADTKAQPFYLRQRKCLLTAGTAACASGSRAADRAVEY